MSTGAFLRGLAAPLLGVALWGGLGELSTAESGAPAPWQTPQESDRIVLENDTAKVVIWPYAGGAITEYVNKETDTNFVAGTVEPGKSYYGWADVSRVAPQDPQSEWFASRPHEFRQWETPAGLHVELRSRLRGVESGREILLDRHSAKLRVKVYQRNISDQPRRLYPRWHPYMMMDDPYAKHSSLYLPDTGGNLRTIKTGIGWDDQFLNPGGFALAANWESDEGLWMTYESQKVPYLATWTDYLRNKPHPLRGAFTVEPQLMPVLKAPGEEVSLTYEYFPFTKKTPTESFPMETIGDPKAISEAQRFLRLVRPHMALIAGHTMVPTPPFSAAAAIEQNRFSFLHARRDRMALRDWGIADALFSMPGKQDIPARIRFYGRLFPDQKKPCPLSYVFFVQDRTGRRVLEEKRAVTLTPEAPEADLRVEAGLSDLPDGDYEVGVAVYEQGGTTPIHLVTEHRSLVGTRSQELAKMRKHGLQERPFVSALRQVPFHAQSLESLKIPIGIEDASGLPRTLWPITAGVPFPQGMVRPDTPLKLSDPQGHEVGFDSRVAGTWDDGSIRWLLLDFEANVPADSHVFYHLTSAPPRVQHPPNLLRQEGSDVIFQNGTTTWRWSPSEKATLLGPLQGEGLWWTDAKGTRYRFHLKGEGAGLTIEQNGAYRAVVRATGWYYADGIDKPIARGTLRFEGYRSQPFLKIAHNVLFAGDPWNDGLSSYGLALPLPDAREGAIGADVDGATKEFRPPFQIRQVAGSTCILKDPQTETLAHRASGAFSFPRKTDVRTVVFRNFWQLNPKEVAMTVPSQVTFFYWPEQPMNFLPREDGWIPSSATPEAIAVGMSRTHDLYLWDGPARNLQETDRLFNEPVIALVPPRYLAETNAMMHLQPYDPDRWPEVEEILSEAFDSYFLNQQLWDWTGAWTYGALPNAFLPEEYRWADFGRYAHILNEEDIVQTAWLAYMRSGDRKYLKFAEANTRQLMEVSTIQWNATIWPEFVGLSRRHHECVWLGDGDYGHTMLDPFLEMYRVTGYEPAWEAAQATAEAMKRQRTGEWRYLSNPLAGLSRMALETQDPSYRKAADRLWKDLCFPDRNTWWLYNHGNRAALYYSQLNPECQKIWEDWALRLPDRFNRMDVLSALYLKTKDPKYATAAMTAFQAFAKQSRKSVANDPLRWSIGAYTQHILAGLREVCYVGSTLEAASRETKASPTPQK